MSAYHLIFCGRGLTIFSSLKIGSGSYASDVKLVPEPNGIEARIRWIDLPAHAGCPPRLFWSGALQKIWPGTWEDSSTRDIVIPLQHLILTFGRRADSEEAVGQLIGSLYKAARRSRDYTVGIHLLRQVSKNMARPNIREWARQWLKNRDKRFAGRQRRLRVQKQAIKRRYPRLDWDFLDLVVLGCWEKLRHENRLDQVFYRLGSCISTISESGVAWFDRHDPARYAPPHSSGLYQYLYDRGFPLKIGPLTSAEIESSGYVHPRIVEKAKKQKCLGAENKRSVLAQQKAKLLNFISGER